MIFSISFIPVNQRRSLRMVNHQTFLDCLFVIIRTTRFLTAFDKTGHQFVFGNFQVQHNRHFLSTFVQHLLQCFSLGDGTGKAVENNTLAVFEAIEYTCKYINHQSIGY